MMRKVSKVINFYENPKLTGWYDLVFVSLRTGTSCKWLYMGRCWRKEWRHLRDVSSAIRFLFFRGYMYSKPKNSSLTNQYNFSSSLITEFGRSINTFKCTKRYFALSIYFKDRYQQFEQKCAREVTIDGRSVDLLSEKIKKNDKFLMNQYINPKLKMTLFSQENLKGIELIIQDYNLLVTKLLIIHLQRFKTVGERIIQNNLSIAIQKLQCIFIESFSIAIYATSSIKSSSDSTKAGTDFVRFKTKQEFLKAIQEEKLKKTKYFYSKKSKKVKKDLPKVIVDNYFKDSNLADNQAFAFNNLLQLNLLKKVNLKYIRKNYKSSSVKKIWVFESTDNSYIPLGVITIRDRILQKIIYLSILPIVEYQSDSNSFGFRKQRSAHQAISIVADSMIKYTKSNQPTKQSSIHKINKNKHKFSINGGNIGSLRKGTKKFNWFYYKLLPVTLKQVYLKRYTPYMKYINVDVVKSFDKVSHNIILELVPLVSKYKFLLKSWLKAPIVGLESWESKKIIKIISDSGVPQGPIMGPLVCNLVLDGLETIVYKVCLANSHYKFNTEKQNFAKTKSGVKNLNINRETNVTCLRFIGDIFISGLADRSTMVKINLELIKFLNSRGLSVNLTKSNVKVFCPGNSFRYLGFQFYFPDYKNNNLNKSRFIKYQNDLTSSYHRLKPFIMIEPKSLASIKAKMRKIFIRSLASKPLNVIINKNNTLIRGICNYYSISRECQLQLNSFEPYLYRYMWKTIKQKFSSKPKLISFIRSNFVKKSRFISKRIVQLKLSDVKPYGAHNILWIRPTQKVLNLNIYLDAIEISKYFLKKPIGLNWSPLTYHSNFDKQELHNILIDYQDNLCPICFKKLSQSRKELDHDPSIYDLQEMIWFKLNKIALGNLSTNSSTGLEIFEKLVKLSKTEIEHVILNLLEQRLYLRSVHSKCYKSIDKDLSKKEIHWRSRIKMLGNNSLAHKIIAMQNNIKVFIKGRRKLSYPQIKEISLKRNLNKNVEL